MKAPHFAKGWIWQLLRCISWLVPQECRQEWLETWTSELHHWVDRRSPPPLLALLRHLAGACSHAGWLRVRQWSPGTVLQDMRYGFRQLSRNLGFTLTAVAVLALGIGATTTVFTFLNGLLLRPLSVVKEPDRLVSLWRTQDGRGNDVVSYPVYEHYRDENDVLEGLAAFASRTLPIVRGDSLLLVQGLLVSHNYFRILGIEPLLGESFQAEQRDHLVAIISHRLWEEYFAGNPAVLGSRLEIRGIPVEIQGILPTGFHGTDRLTDPDLWLPIGLEAQIAPGRWGNRLEQADLSWLQLVGRLQPGVTLSQASQSLRTLAGNLRQLYPENGNSGIVIRPADGLDPETRRQALPVAAILMGLVGLLLLISCANVSSLILARNGLRKQELGVRLALGSGRLRLIRQLLSESLVLSLLAAGAAILLTRWSGRIMVSLFARFYGTSFSIDPTPDQRVLFFALGLGVLCVVLIGLGPSLRSTRSDLMSSLKPGGGRLTRGKKWRSWLVTGQFAVCVLVLTGGGLLLRTLSQMQKVQPGFGTENIVVYTLFPEFLGLSQERATSFYRQLLEQLEDQPGFLGIALSTSLPLVAGYESAGIQTAEFPHLNRPFLVAERNVVAGDFFENLSIPVRRGRSFAAGDTEDGIPAVIVSESLAAILWPGQDALGEVFEAGGEAGLRVVGVVADIKHRDVRESQKLAFYRPLSQDPRGRVFLQIKAREEPRLVDSRLESIMDGLLPAHPLSGTRLSDRIEESFGQERLLVRFSAIFSLAALLLTGVGLYGVIAFSVNRQRQEIGIRCALGAETSHVLRQVLAEGLRMSLRGVLLGLVLVALLSRIVNLKSALYGVSSLDPLTIGATLIILLAVSLLASFVPAWRAASLDPARALHRH